MTSTEAPVFLVGATGVGKSALGMELARATGGAILAMDAMQVYCGADIGTSKPTLAEQAEVPHGGVDLVDFGSSFDVAQYLRHADQFLREQREAGRRVIIVGGTGLYFRALTRGLCEAPQGSKELRAELSALSTEQLRTRLGRVDPKMLERIDGANPRRLVRAIEVMEATGRSLRTWQEETPEPLVKNFTAYWICREKEELAQRIEARVEAMFAAGWVEEVRGLVAIYGGGAVRGFAGIGYREIALAMGNQDQICKLAKLPNLGEGEGLTELREADGINGITEWEGEVSHGGGKRGEEEEGRGRGSNEIAGTRAFPSETWERGEGEGNGSYGTDKSDGETMELRGKGHFQNPAEGGKFENKDAQSGAGRRLTLREEARVKGDILVATRQYAKRQLTWFAREPNLRRVMLTGTQPISSVMPSLL